MLTVCPKCTLTLAVTAVDLRLGQGYVRCGRCSAVFNALVALTEESAFDTSSTQPVRALKMPGELPAHDDDQEIFLVAPDPEPATAATEAPPPQSSSALPPEPEAPEPEASAPALPAPEEPLVPEPPAPEPPAGPAASAAAPFDAEPKAGPTVYLRFEHPPVIPKTPAPTRQRGDSVLVWSGLAASLLLLLVSQVIHHWRNELAADVRFYPTLSRVYEYLQLPLTPRWNLTGYDLRQLGTASYGGNDQTLWIKLTLTNSARHALPWPKLKLSLSDKFGKTLSTRILEPRDYLRDGKTPTSFMSPGHQIDTEVGVVNPLTAASSFELDVCTAMGDGLRCASDEALRGAGRS